MATVNKDFKIKSGLVVEGTTGTINGFDILTKKTADQNYIIGLIGGAATSANEADTVVLRDENGDFAAGTITAETGFSGDLTGNVTGTVSDISNHDTDDLAEGATNKYFTESRAQIGVSNALGEGLGYGSFGAGNVFYVDTNVIATKQFATDEANGALAAAEDYAELKATDAQNAAQSYAEGLVQQEASDRNTAISTAITNLDLANTYDAKGAAAQALSDAEDYADAKISDANGSATDKAWSAYKTSTEIGLAQAAAEQHADEAVAELVGSAPELLDTLQELAAALDNDPDAINSLQNIAAGKQDTLTAGNGIVIDDNLIYVPTSIGSGISVTPSTVEIDRAVVDTWYDASGAAATAQGNAEDYADSLAPNYDAAGSASAAQTAAETFATNAINALDTDDIEEGTSNLYFTNQRAIDAVGGTISDQINLLDTDDIEEGSTNLYFTDSRAKTSAAALLTGASKTNIQITGDENGLTITAENGVADSDTDDLVEGSTNLYFTDSRAVGAINDANIQPQSIDITWVRREEATWTGVPTASKTTVHSFGTNEGSVKYLVRVISGPNSHVTEVLATTDSNNNVAVVEYGTIYTSLDPLATVTVEWNAGTSEYDLNVTTAQNSSEVLVAATLLAYND
jgi:hypothetical protein